MKRSRSYSAWFSPPACCQSWYTPGLPLPATVPAAASRRSASSTSSCVGPQQGPSYPGGSPCSRWICAASSCSSRFSAIAVPRSRLGAVRVDHHDARGVRIAAGQDQQAGEAHALLRAGIGRLPAVIVILRRALVGALAAAARHLLPLDRLVQVQGGLSHRPAS